MRWRHALTALLAPTLAAVVATAAGPAGALTVGTAGGAYGESQRIAYFDPFAARSGGDVRVESLGRGLDEVRRGLAADPAPWDAIDVAADVAAAACAEGLLERTESLDLAPAPDGRAAREDFLAGGIGDCGVASVAWSAVIAIDRRAFPKGAPKSLADAFDVGRFAGTRALPRGPRYTLELALMADGVAPDDVYPTLETDEGQARAFAVLDRVRDHVVWWRRGTEPIDLLTEEKAAVALAFNGRLFDAIVRGRRPFDVLWDGQIYDVNVWAIPSRAADKDAARRFVAFATEPARLAEQARRLPYGPMRASAVDLVGRHAEADVAMAAYLPTAPANMSRALRRDSAWWAVHEGPLARRFEAWLAEAEQAPTDAAESADRREP